jgi:hypothetical protein
VKGKVTEVDKKMLVAEAQTEDKQAAGLYVGC